MTEPIAPENKEIPEDLIPVELEIGARLQAHVVEAGEDGYLVGIGTKTEAWMPGRELGSSGREAGVGDTLEVILIRKDRRTGRHVVSRRRVEENETWKVAQAAYDAGTPLEGRIVRSTKGGVHVDVGGLQAFLPRSLLDSRPPPALESLVGTTITALVHEIEPGKNLVLSRVAWQKRQQAKAFDIFARHYGAGSKVTAQVTRMMVRKGQKRPFAALLDCDGTELFLHEEEASWERTSLDKLLTIGQAVEVEVLHVDPETERVRVSRKSTQGNPWQDERLKKGAWLTGKVKNLTKFGVFVDIGMGIDGLVHESEVSSDHRKDMRQVVKPGQEVKVRILNVDTFKRRLSLTLLTEEEAMNPKGESFGEEYQGGSSLADQLGD